MKKVLILALVVTTVLSTWARAVQPPTLQIGTEAPDFKLPGVDGKTYALADFQDAEVLVVLFTCNHCPTAQAYEARIIKLAADYRDKGVALVAISPNDPLAVRLDEMGYTDVGDTLEDMKIRARDAGFKFPYLYDGRTQQVSMAYGPAATPHVFIFDSERSLCYQGRIDDSEKPANVRSHDARNAIDALLSGRQVPVPTTKSFGCSIKWASKRQPAEEIAARYAAEKVSLEKITDSQLAEIARNDTDKLRLVGVWATWSGPSAANLDELVTANRMYRRRDFELITISLDAASRAESVLTTLTDKQASCRNWICQSTDIYKSMAALDAELAGGVPYTLVIEPGGKVIYRKVGPIEPLEMRRAVVGYIGRVYK